MESTWRESVGSGVHRPNQKSNLIGQEAGVPCVGCLLVEKNTCTWLALLFFSDVLAGNHKNLAPLNNKVKKTNHKQLIEDDTQACDHYLIPQARFRQEVCAYNFQLRTEAIKHSGIRKRLQPIKWFISLKRSICIEIKRRNFAGSSAAVFLKQKASSVVHPKPS